MTKNDIVALLSIIPKTGNPDIDTNITKAIAAANASEKPDHIQIQPESDILKACISLMQDVANECADWYDTLKGDGAFKQLEDNEDYPFLYQITYSDLVKRLFLSNTNHNDSNTVRDKCFELNIHNDRLCIDAKHEYTTIPERKDFEI